MISVPEAGLLPIVLRPMRAFEFGDQFARESVRIYGECLREPDSGHLPVAGGGVLSRRMVAPLP